MPRDKEGLREVKPKPAFYVDLAFDPAPHHRQTSKIGG
jgi:hypothetical protein